MVNLPADYIRGLCAEYIAAVPHPQCRGSEAQVGAQQLVEAEETAGPGYMGQSAMVAQIYFVI